MQTFFALWWIVEKLKYLKVFIIKIEKIYYNRYNFWYYFDSLITSAAEEISCLQRTLKDLVTNIDKSYSDKHDEFFVGFEGS